MSAYTQNFVYKVGKRKNPDYDPSLISKERLAEIKQAAAKYVERESGENERVKD